MLYDCENSGILFHMCNVLIGYGYLFYSTQHILSHIIEFIEIEYVRKLHSG